MQKTMIALVSLGIVCVWVCVAIFICDSSNNVNLAEALEASGSLFTALAFAAAGYAVFLQNRSIALQVQDLKSQREELEATRCEVVAQREQMQLQTSAINKQVFETTLFKLIDIKTRYIHSIKLKDSTGINILVQLLRECHKDFESDFKQGKNKFCELMNSTYGSLVPYVNLVLLILDKIFSEEMLSESAKFEYIDLVKVQFTPVEVCFLVYFIGLMPDAGSGVAMMNRSSLFANFIPESTPKEIVVKFKPQAFGQASYDDLWQSVRSFHVGGKCPSPEPPASL